MKVLTLFRRKETSARRQDPRPSSGHAKPEGHLRREMVSMALRDTLHRHGIPKDWLAADTLLVRGPRGDYQCYVRILLTHWEPQLLTHASALEASFIKRLSLFDRTSHHWLRGVSWQLGGPPRPGLPSTMPPPSTWHHGAHPAPEPAPAPAAVPAPEPVSAAQSQRAELAAIFSGGDERYQLGRRGEIADFQPTQPFLPADAGPH